MKQLHTAAWNSPEQSVTEKTPPTEIAHWTWLGK